jgi:hypothetical protein
MGHPNRSIYILQEYASLRGTGSGNWAWGKVGFWAECRSQLGSRSDGRGGCGSVDGIEYIV